MRRWISEECCKHQNNFRCRVDVNCDFTSRRLRLLSSQPPRQHLTPHWVEKWVCLHPLTDVGWLWLAISAKSSLLFFLTSPVLLLCRQPSARNRQQFWLTIEWEREKRACHYTGWVLMWQSEKNSAQKSTRWTEVETWRNKYFLTTHHCHHSSQHVCFARYTRCGE